MSLILASGDPYYTEVDAEWSEQGEPGIFDFLGANWQVIDPTGTRVFATNTVADNSLLISYTPDDTNDWPGTDPTNVASALDLLAARVDALENP